MPKESATVRVYLTQQEARHAVRDAIIKGRVNWNIAEESETYFRLKQRNTFLHAPVRMEVGFRKESPETTIVVMNGAIRWSLNDRPRLRLESQMAEFADDIESYASDYVSQG